MLVAGTARSGSTALDLLIGERFDGILHGLEVRPFDERRYPFTFTVDGQRWGLDLRRVVYDLPFHVRLKDFVKRDHPGTMTAADSRSFAQPPEEEAREAPRVDFD